MGNKFKIKPPILAEPSIVKATSILVFSFAELRSFSFMEAGKDGKFFIQYLERLKKLGSLDWNTVNISARHSFGLEKMKVSNLTTSAQQLVPAGIDSLLVLRATGDNHVFLGTREGNVFHVIFIEYQFGDVYKHGK